MKSGAKGVRGMSIKNMEKFIKNHGQSVLRIKKDRMSLGQIFTKFKEGKNKLEEGRNLPKSPSPNRNRQPTSNHNFNTLKNFIRKGKYPASNSEKKSRVSSSKQPKKNSWVNMNNNGNLPSLPVSPASSTSGVSGYSSSPNEGKNFVVKQIRAPRNSRFNEAPKKGSMNIFPVKGYRKPLSKVPVLKKRVVLTFTVGGNQRAKPPPSRMYGKFPKENEYNAPVGKSMGRKGVVPFNTTHFRPLRSNSPPRRIVEPSIPKKEPFILKKFLQSIKSKK